MEEMRQEIRAEDIFAQMESAPVMTKERLQELTDTLQEYKAGKSNLEARVKEAEQFWKLRHWSSIRKKQPGEIEPASGWITNSILSKHSDAMDAYPEAILLAREPQDQETAKMLSDIVPVIMDHAGFKQAWSDEWWDKLKAGTGIFSPVWDAAALNGLGDIAIKVVDILNIYWKPGISHIQDSPYVFYVHLEEEAALKKKYPQLEGKDVSGNATMVSTYIYDDTVSTDGMTAVIDCYYKKDGLLHFCQYVGDTALYASEEDKNLRGRGFYDHGLYPFVFDALWPEKGYPNCGFGYVDLDRDAQITVDILNSAFTKNILVGAIPRYFSSADGNVNAEDVLDLTKPIVNVNGSVDEASLREIKSGGLPAGSLDFLQLKVNEMKEVGGNRDVNNGGTGSVTAASAIAALQEAGNGLSRDMIDASYRAYAQVVDMVIELIRQFYTEPRMFRILGQYNMPQYVSFSNAGMAPQHQGNEFGQDMGMRKPVFDIEVEIQSESTYTKEGYNQLAIQLFQMQVFNPQMADQAMMMLDMMDFKGKDDLQRKIAQNQQLLINLQQWQQLAVSLAQKYEPEMARAIMQSMVPAQGDPAVGAIPGKQVNAEDIRTDAGPKEDTRVKKARQNAQDGAKPR